MKNTLEHKKVRRGQRVDMHLSTGGYGPNLFQMFTFEYDLNRPENSHNSEYAAPPHTTTGREGFPCLPAHYSADAAYSADALFNAARVYTQALNTIYAPAYAKGCTPIPAPAPSSCAQEPDPITPNPAPVPSHQQPTSGDYRRFCQRMAAGGYRIADFKSTPKKTAEYKALNSTSTSTTTGGDTHTYSVRINRIGPIDITAYYQAPKNRIPQALLALLNQAEADYNLLLKHAKEAGALGVPFLRDTPDAIQAEARAFHHKYGVFLSPRPCYSVRCTKFTCQNSIHHRYVAATSRRMEMNTHSAMITIPGIMGAHQFKPIWDAAIEGIKAANLPKGHHCIGVIEPHANGITTDAMHQAQNNNQGSLHYHLINPLNLPANITAIEAEDILDTHIRAALAKAGLTVDVHVQIASVKDLKQYTDYIAWYLFKNLDVKSHYRYAAGHDSSGFSLYKRHIELNSLTPGNSPYYSYTQMFFRPFDPASTFSTKNKATNKSTENIVPALAADFNRRYIGATEGKFASTVTWDTNAGEEVTIERTYRGRTWTATGHIITTTARRDVPKGPYVTLDSYPEHTIAEAIELCRTQLEQTLNEQLYASIEQWELTDPPAPEKCRRVLCAATSYLRYTISDSYPEHTIAEAIALCRTQLEETLRLQLAAAIARWTRTHHAGHRPASPFTAGKYLTGPEPDGVPRAAATSHLSYSTVRIRAPPTTLPVTTTRCAESLILAHTITITVCVQAIRQTRYALLPRCVPGFCRAYGLSIQPFQAQNLQASPEPALANPSCLSSSSPSHPAHLSCLLAWTCLEPMGCTQALRASSWVAIGSFFALPVSVSADLHPLCFFHPARLSACLCLLVRIIHYPKPRQYLNLGNTWVLALAGAHESCYSSRCPLKPHKHEASNPSSV